MFGYKELSFTVAITIAGSPARESTDYPPESVVTFDFTITPAYDSQHIQVGLTIRLLCAAICATHRHMLYIIGSKS